MPTPLNFYKKNPYNATGALKVDAIFATDNSPKLLAFQGWLSDGAVVNSLNQALIGENIGVVDTEGLNVNLCNRFAYTIMSNTKYADKVDLLVAKFQGYINPLRSTITKGDFISFIANGVSYGGYTGPRAGYGYKIHGITKNQEIDIISMVYSAGDNSVTVTTDTDHKLVTGDKIIITRVVPTAFNSTSTSGNIDVIRLSDTTFKYSVVSNPGTYSSGGKVLKLEKTLILSEAIRGISTLRTTATTGATTLNLNTPAQGQIVNGQIVTGTNIATGTTVTSYSSTTGILTISLPTTGGINANTVLNFEIDSSNSSPSLPIGAIVDGVSTTNAFSSQNVGGITFFQRAQTPFNYYIPGDSRLKYFWSSYATPNYTTNFDGWSQNFLTGTGGINGDKGDLRFVNGISGTQVFMLYGGTLATVAEDTFNNIDKILTIERGENGDDYSPRLKSALLYISASNEQGSSGSRTDLSKGSETPGVTLKKVTNTLKSNNGYWVGVIGGDLSESTSNQPDRNRIEYIRKDNPDANSFRITPQATATATFANGATNITVSNVSGTIVIGQTITGLGIYPGTTVTNVNGTTITLSNATTSDRTAITLKFINSPEYKRLRADPRGFVPSVGIAKTIKFGVPIAPEFCTLYPNPGPGIDQDGMYNIGLNYNHNFTYETPTPATPITLNGSINSSVTEITVNDSTALRLNTFIKIDNEYFGITNIVNNLITVQRARLNSTAASHNSGASISIVPYCSIRIRDCVYEDINGIYRAFVTDVDPANSKSFWITYKGSSVFPSIFVEPYPFGEFGFAVNLTMLFSVPNTFYRRSTYNYLYPAGAGENYVPTVQGGVGDRKEVLATVKVSETNGFLEKGTTTLGGKISLYTIPGLGFYAGLNSGIYYSYYQDIIFQSTVTVSPVAGASSVITKVYDSGLTKVSKGQILKTYVIFDQVKSSITSYTDEVEDVITTSLTPSSTTITTSLNIFTANRYAVISSTQSTNFEIVRITNNSGGLLTVLRGQLGTIARDWSNGSSLRQYATLTLSNIQQINSPSTADSTFTTGTDTIILTNVSGTISIGQVVTGTGIASNTTVVSYTSNGNVLVLSNPTTSSTSSSLSFNSVISTNNIIRGKNITGNSLVIDYTGSIVTVSDNFLGNPTPDVGEFIYFGVPNLTKSIDLLVNKRNNFKDISGVVSFPGYGYKIGNALTTSPLSNPSFNVASAFWTFDSEISPTGLITDGIAAPTTFSVVYTEKTGESSGNGVGAKFTVIRDPNGSYRVTVSDLGSGYVLGESITISGFDLGGISPENDLTIVVGQLNDLSKVTMQTTEPHGFVPPAGRTTCRLLIKNVSPTNYNGRYEATILDEFTFSYQLPDDPGTYQTGGTVKNISIDVINDTFSFLSNKLFLNITETEDLEYPYIRYFQRATVLNKVVTVVTDEDHHLTSTSATSTFAAAASTITLTNPITTGVGSLKIGQGVSGTGIQPSTVVTAVNGNIITLSRPTASAQTGIAVLVGDRVNVGGVINSTRVSWNESNTIVTVLDSRRFNYTILSSGNEGLYINGGYITDPRILPFGGVYTKNFDRMIFLNISDQIVGGETNPKSGLASNNIIQPRKARDFLVRNLNFRQRSNDNDIVEPGDKNDYVVTSATQLAISQIVDSPLVNAVWEDGRILATSPSDIPISNITNTGNTITVTTSTAHPFLVGNNVVVAGSSVDDCNGEFTVLTVPTSTTFTYETTLTPTSTQSFAAPTATWTNASTTITVSSSTGISVGQYAIATGIPYQTKVTDINGNIITLSKSTTTTQSTATTVRFSSLTTGSKHHLYVGNKIDVNDFNTVAYNSSSQEDTVLEIVDDYNFYYGEVQLSDGSFFGKERLIQPAVLTSTPPTRIGSFSKSASVFPEGIDEITVVSNVRSVPGLDDTADHYVVSYNAAGGQAQYTTFSISLTLGGTTEIYQKAISTVEYTQSVNKATVFTDGPHSLVTGDVVTISSINPSAYNGNFKITKISSNSFSYTPPQVKSTASLPSVEGNTSYNINGATTNATYTQSGTVITVTSNGHGLSIGSTVYLDFTGAPTDGYYTVTTAATNSFTVYRATSATITATAVTWARAYSLAAPGTTVSPAAITKTVNANTAIGSNLIPVASVTDVTIGQSVLDGGAITANTTAAATASATMTAGSTTVTLTGIVGTISVGQYINRNASPNPQVFYPETIVTSFTSTGTGTGTVTISQPAASSASFVVGFRTNRIPVGTRVIGTTTIGAQQYIQISNNTTGAIFDGAGADSTIQLVANRKDSYALTLSSVSNLHVGQVITTDTSQLASTAIIDSINTTTNTIGLSSPLTGSSVRATYTKSAAANTITVTSTAHGLSVGDKILVEYLSDNGTLGYFVVQTVSSANSFVYTDTVAGNVLSAAAINYQKIPGRIFASSNVAQSKSLRVASTTGVVVGYSVSGPSVPLTTTVVSIDSANNRVYLSERLTGTFSQPSATSTFASGATTLTLSSIVGTIAVGQTVSGSGIAANTYVTAYNSATSTITLSIATTSSQTNASLSFNDTITFGVGDYVSGGFITPVVTPIVNNRLIRRGVYSNGAINVIPDKLGWDHVSCAKDSRGAIFFQLGYSKIMSGTAGSTTLTISSAAPYNETNIAAGILSGYFVYGEGIQGETRILSTTNTTITIDKPLLADVTNQNVGISRKDSVSIFPKYTVEFGRVLGKTFAEWLFKIA